VAAVGRHDLDPPGRDRVLGEDLGAAPERRRLRRLRGDVLLAEVVRRPDDAASSTSTRMPSRDSQKSSADRPGVTGVLSMFAPPRSGAYVSGTVVGVITSGAGSGLSCETTVVVGLPISVTDRFDVVATDSPAASG